MIYEYKVLGNQGVQADGKPLSLVAALDAAHDGARPNVYDAQAILNVLGAEGWEPVLLAFPYVFRRPAPEQETADRA